MRRARRQQLALQVRRAQAIWPSAASGTPYWIWDTRSAGTDLLKHWWEIFPQSYWNWKEMEGSGTG